MTSHGRRGGSRDRGRGKGRGAGRSGQERVDMADLPRQEDLGQRRQSIEQAMQEDTKDPGSFSGVPTSQHVSDLLVAINKIETLHGSQVPTHRARDQSRPQARFPPIPHSSRIREILDAFAILCVSRKKHEVIAIAVRHDASRGIVAFMMASNSDVPRETERHFYDMWKKMQGLAEQFQALRGPHDEDISPTSPIEDTRFQSLYREFSRLCLSFVWPRLQSRVNGKFSRFMQVVRECSNLVPNHPFSKVEKSIRTVESMFTREEGHGNRAKIGKPKNDEEWQWLYDSMEDARRDIDALLSSEKARRDVNMARIQHFPELERYLRKFNSFFNSIEILARATVSVKTRQLLPCRCTLETLREQSTRLANVPTTTSDWERVLRDALAYDNLRSDPGKQGTLVMDMNVIRKDTALMGKTAISKNNSVHCEIKLLVSIERHQEARPGIPKAFTYIGVSKLSCHGCDSFIRAFNAEHNTSWVTKGGHGKSYYPWMFPPGTPAEDYVRERTYAILAFAWAKSYTGYRQQHVSLNPDSTAQSARSTNAFDWRKRDAVSVEKFERLRLQNASP